MSFILKTLILLSTIVLVALVIKFHVHEVQVSFLIFFFFLILLSNEISEIVIVITERLPIDLS